MKLKSNLPVIQVTANLNASLKSEILTLYYENPLRVVSSTDAQQVRTRKMYIWYSPNITKFWMHTKLCNSYAIFQLTCWCCLPIPLLLRIIVYKLKVDHFYKPVVQLCHAGRRLLFIYLSMHLCCDLVHHPQIYLWLRNNKFFLCVKVFVILCKHIWI